ncbi:MAG: tRNA pseudouridine(55) synthase TruB [Clostridia bacterium]|nr:tRNA pseudouridine(55) synthase TruB [Clostridia bacterium]
MKKQPKIKTLGFFCVDKPSGLTSSTVVNKLKWLCGLPAGHMGTLDPLASGVLPVGIGNATRLFNYFLEKRKTYLAEFTFGVESDTLDSTGELIYGGQVPSEREIEGVLNALCGEVMQLPPKYSAKSVNGRRGYELARAGVEFTLQPKKVNIYAMKLLGKGETENSFRFEIECGGGTYIRSIARDMAELLGTKAVMSGLRRTQSGAFEIDRAIPFEWFLREEITPEELEEKIIPTESVLPFKRLTVTEKEEARLLFGQTVPLGVKDGTYQFHLSDGSFYGLAEVKGGKGKLTTKLCL